MLTKLAVFVAGLLCGTAGVAGILAPTASAMLHNVSTLVFSLLSTRPLIGEETR